MSEGTYAGNTNDGRTVSNAAAEVELVIRMLTMKSTSAGAVNRAQVAIIGLLVIKHPDIAKDVADAMELKGWDVGASENDYLRAFLLSRASR